MDIAKQYNIAAADAGKLTWDGANLAASLAALRAYAEQEAIKAEQWYWNKKKWKARPSRFIQFSALTLTAAGGMYPIASVLWAGAGTTNASTLPSGLVSSLCVGLAAGAIGLDKAFGFSSGWARYILAASSIRKALEEYRMDWTSLAAAQAAAPTPEQVATMIQRTKDFRLAVESIVFQETKDWVTEFQAGMAQLEKDVKTQLDALKAQVDKAAQTQAANDQPGSLEVNVDNADKMDGFTFTVTLENDKGKIVDEATVKNSHRWVGIGIPAGLYRLTVSGAIAGAPKSTASAVAVKPADIVKIGSVTL